MEAMTWMRMPDSPFWTQYFPCQPSSVPEAAGLDCLAEFAVDNMDHEDDRVRVAAVRALKVLTSVVTRENACYERVRKAVTEMDTGSITMVFLQYRILTNLRAGYRVPAGDPVRQRRGQ